MTEKSHRAAPAPVRVLALVWVLALASALVPCCAVILSSDPVAHASGGSDSPGATELSNDWYFAEGTTRSDAGSEFTTYMAVLNPCEGPATVTFMYLPDRGEPVTRNHVIAARSRFTLNVLDDMGFRCDFATHVQSDRSVLAERPMYFKYSGIRGGHDSIGALKPATAWYFAEGTTRPGFVTYLSVMNPGGREALVDFTYMLGSGEPVTARHAVAARSRFTIDVSREIGGGRDVSIFIKSDELIVAERPMYFEYTGRMGGGSDSLGINDLSTAWYFAEGTTRPGFVTYLSVMNPGGREALVDFTYMLGSGEPVTARHAVAARSRFTIDVSRDIGGGRDVSVFIKSDEGIVAERPMYFEYTGRWDGGHVAPGVPAPQQEWRFAEGTTREGFVTYLAVLNPDTSPCTVDITYMLGSGQRVERSHSLRPRSRHTIDVSSEVGAGQDVAATLSSTGQVVVERPMYFRIPSKGIVCVDPGHSGRTGSEIDPATGLNVGDNTGCPGELEAVWELARVLKARLEDAGYEVRMTKNGVYDYVSLRERADIGNRCDLAVRLHYDDSGYTGVMRAPVNAARCPVSDPSRITVIDPGVAAASDVLARHIAAQMGLAVRDDTGGTSQGNATPAGHPTCLIGSVLSSVPVVCIENRGSALSSPAGMEEAAAGIVRGVDSAYPYL